MVDDLKNIFLAAIGTAAYSYEKGMNLVDEMVKKGKLTVDEGKELSEELKRNITSKKETKTEESKPLTKADIADLLQEMNFVTKDDFSDIRDRLTKLENSNK